MRVLKALLLPLLPSLLLAIPGPRAIRRLRQGRWQGCPPSTPVSSGNPVSSDNPVSPGPGRRRRHLCLPGGIHDNGGFRVLTVLAHTPS